MFGNLDFRRGIADQRYSRDRLANGEKREGFQIEVIDALNDTTKDFSVMSGGQ